MTVTGLATVDLSTLSVMQQVIMFWQMLIGSLVRASDYPFVSCLVLSGVSSIVVRRSADGDQTFVSIIMIMVRR